MTDDEGLIEAAREAIRKLGASALLENVADDPAVLPFRRDEELWSQFLDRLRRALRAAGLVKEGDESVNPELRLPGGGGMSMSGGQAMTSYERAVAAVGQAQVDQWLAAHEARKARGGLALSNADLAGRWEGAPRPQARGPSPARVAEINDERLRGFGVPAAAPAALSLDDGLDEASDNAGSWGGSSSAWPADVTPERARQVAEEMMVTIGVRPGRRT
jgi:hypothetical protein